MTVAPTSLATGRIEVRELCHAFGPTEVLAGIDLCIEPGEFVAVLGPSGCGKTTLLRVLAGLLAPDGGTARIDGVDIVGRTGCTAYQPQRDALLPWRRVVANAALGAELTGVPKHEARARAADLLARFGLEGFERAWPAQLSGGMRQRVAVARSFLAGRLPLLLDEPFGALDALTRRQLYGWLEGIWEADAEHRTALLVTHDVDEAITLADRVVVMSARPGRIVAEETVAFERPRRPELLAAPEWGAARARLLTALGLIVPSVHLDPNWRVLRVAGCAFSVPVRGAVGDRGKLTLVDVTAEMESAAPPEALFVWIDDLALYPRWLGIVARAEEAPPHPGDDGPAWSIDLRGRLGPLARAKRLRMVRTEHESPLRVTFERREHDGRDHAAWVLEAELTAAVGDYAAGERTRMVMHLHYGGSLFGPVLQRVLREEIERSRPRLATLVEGGG